MNVTRRSFTLGSLLAAGTAGLPVFVKAQEGRTLAIMFDSLQSPFWVAGIDALKERAVAAGFEPVESISNLDDAKQFEQVQSMIQLDVAGIILVQTDANAVIPAIRAANEAGVPMVHFNRPPAESDAVSVSVVSDNYAIMHQAVTELVAMARAQGGTYKAAILIGDLGDQNAIQRRDAFNDVVAENADIIEVVANISTEWNADKAFADLTNALQANPDINFLVTSSDFLIPQIEQALKIAGKWKRFDEEGHVLFGGLDGDEGAYQALLDGYMDVDGVQNLFATADLAIDAIQRMIAGEEVDRVLQDPGFVITRETLEEERDQMWGYTVWQTQNG